MHSPSLKCNTISIIIITVAMLYFALEVWHRIQLKVNKFQSHLFSSFLMTSPSLIPVLDNTDVNQNVLDFPTLLIFLVFYQVQSTYLEKENNNEIFSWKLVQHCNTASADGKELHEISYFLIWVTETSLGTNELFYSKEIVKKCTNHKHLFNKRIKRICWKNPTLHIWSVLYGTFHRVACICLYLFTVCCIWCDGLVGHELYEMC